jgi:hypothetical protein
MQWHELLGRPGIQAGHPGETHLELVSLGALAGTAANADGVWL